MPFSHNDPHIDLVIQELLPQARTFVAEGQRRLAAQEAIVDGLEAAGRNKPESKKLLANLRQSMALQIGHMKLLEREIRAAGRKPLEPSSND
ncbi:MAG: hypothetical protein WCD69_00095 [Xanthobacteraceae bacterium]